jgi:hypothetical protein
MKYHFEYHVDIEADSEEKAHRQFLNLFVNNYPWNVAYDFERLGAHIFRGSDLVSLDPFEPAELHRYEVRYGGNLRQERTVCDTYTQALEYVADLKSTYGSTMHNCDITRLACDDA